MPRKSKGKSSGMMYKAKQYLRENWGSPFIIAFMVLLMACACLLVQGNSGLANDVAVYAYYLLVAGVVLQLISFVRHGKESKPEDNEG